MGKIDLLQKMHEEGIFATDAVLMLPYYLDINRLFREGRFNEVDRMLVFVNPELISTELLVGVLRLSYCAKHKLPGWDEALSKFSAEVETRGEEVEKIFEGLL